MKKEEILLLLREIKEEYQERLLYKEYDQNSLDFGVFRHKVVGLEYFNIKDKIEALDILIKKYKKCGCTKFSF